MFLGLALPFPSCVVGRFHGVTRSDRRGTSFEAVNHKSFHSSISGQTAAWLRRCAAGEDLEAFPKLKYRLSLFSRINHAPSSPGLIRKPLTLTSNSSS